MKARWPRFIPVLAAMLLGMLGSLLLGDGPRSVMVGEAMQDAWMLPPTHQLDLASADGIWNERHPWGRPEGIEAEAAAQVAPVAVPVGVVDSGGTPKALFSMDGALPVGVEEGGVAPDGSSVISITPTVIEWRDADGATRHHELFVEPTPSRPSNVGGNRNSTRTRPDAPPNGRPPPRQPPRPGSN